MKEAIRIMTKEKKAVKPDSISSEMLEIDNLVIFRRFHSILVAVWRTGEVPQQHRDDAIIKAVHKKKGRSSLAATTEGSPLCHMPVKFPNPFQRSLRG